jgi:anti-sigma factor RsiW
MVNDTDLELIEAYLDDALSTDDVEQLDRRLAYEPQLAAALGKIRTQRALRTMAWMSREPSAESSEQLAGRIASAIRQRQAARTLARWARAAGALAACILFGFVAGWIGRGRAEPATFHAMPAGAISHAAMTLDSSGVYQVALTDDGGNVLAVQRFARYEDARQFAADLSGYEARRRQVQQGRAVLVSDKF